MAAPLMESHSWPSNEREKRRRRAKMFVQVMHANHYSFADLAHENIDRQSLRALYEELGLPCAEMASNAVNFAKNAALNGVLDGATRPASGSHPMSVGIEQSGTNNTNPVQSQSSTNPTHFTSTATNVVQSPFTSTTAVQSSTNTNSIQSHQTAPNGVKSPTEIHPKPAAGPIDRKDYIARLLAAKSRKAATQESTGSTAKTPVTSVASPPKAAPSAPGSSIPGLFMVKSAAAATSASQTTVGTSSQPVVSTPVSPVVTSQSRVPSPSVTSKKRPLTADFDDDNVSGQPPHKSQRPFGASQSQNFDEEFIIEVSDDESDAEGGPAKIGAQPRLMIAASPSQNGVKEAVKPSPHTKHTLGTVGSPAVSAPLGVRHLEKAEEEIVAMKKRIADLEQRKRDKERASQSQLVSRSQSSSDGEQQQPVGPLTPAHPCHQASAASEHRAAPFAASPAAGCGSPSGASAAAAAGPARAAAAASFPGCVRCSGRARRAHSALRRWI